MRIDKFLKNSRLIKRRTIAKEACEKGMILINDKIAKPSDEVKVGDSIKLKYPNREINISVEEIIDSQKKEDSERMYKIL